MNFATDVERTVVQEIHKPARINFKRRIVILKGLNDLFQVDLFDKEDYSHENNEYKFILVVINYVSKFVWALPLKTKTRQEITDAVEKILKKKSPKNLLTDAGLEFINQHFKKLMKKYNVNHYNTFSEKKASIVKQVDRTLKNILWK